MNAATMINQTSGNVEIFTPPLIIEAARKALGGIIELDPASCEAANRTVGALRYFTKEIDGLSLDWKCHTLWMNHPFSKGEDVCDPATCKRKTCRDRGYHCEERVPSNSEWINKLVQQYLDGRIGAACCITFASTSEEWFRPLLDYPQCFLWPRTNYLLPDGSVYRGVTKGSVVTYLGLHVDLFRESFKGLGTVKI